MHGSVKNIVGNKYGRLTVVDAAGRNSNRTVVWQCRCDCGVLTKSTGADLKRGHKKSCGCFAKEKAAIGIVSRSTKHGKKWTLAYKSWEGIIQRCTNTNCKKYPDYGGRGIKVCDRWRKFEEFSQDMGERPSKMHSIGRIDNDGNYEPGNCRWELPGQQSKNQRINSRNKTGTPGVFWKKQAGKYQAKIGVDGKRIHLGYFTSLESAVAARAAAQIKYWAPAPTGQAFQK